MGRATHEFEFRKLANVFAGEVQWMVAVPEVKDMGGLADGDSLAALDEAPSQTSAEIACGPVSSMICKS